MKNFYFFFILIGFNIINAQEVKKMVNDQTQVWLSVNSLFSLNNNLSLIGDFHVRTNHFLSDENFYFLRTGLNYKITKESNVAIGIAHMWLAPPSNDLETFANENRIYQQWQISSKVLKSNLLMRIRNEQRWQEKIVNDQHSNNYRFTNRVRFLFSSTTPVFKSSNKPALVISDEVLFHFGKEVVYNTFDQNRFFIGIRQRVNSNLSFDFGYMNVFQQKYTAKNYDMNHTLRLFFYLNSSALEKSHEETGD